MADITLNKLAEKAKVISFIKPMLWKYLPDVRVYKVF